MGAVARYETLEGRGPGDALLVLPYQHVAHVRCVGERLHPSGSGLVAKTADRLLHLDCLK